MLYCPLINAYLPNEVQRNLYLFHLLIIFQHQSGIQTDRMSKRDSMLDVFSVLGLYSDPDGHLEAKRLGGKDSNNVEANREILRSKYGNQMRRADKRPNSVADMRKAELERQRKLRQQRLMELERTKRLEAEAKKERAGLYKRGSAPHIDVTLSLAEGQMGRKKNLEGRRLSYYMQEEEKPKLSVARKIYNILKKMGRRNYYDPHEQEDKYDPSVMVNDEVDLVDTVRHKMFKFGNTRRMEKRKLRRGLDEKVEMKGLRVLKTAEDKVLFMGLLDGNAEKLSGVR